MVVYVVPSKPTSAIFPSVSPLSFHLSSPGGGRSPAPSTVPVTFPYTVISSFLTSDEVSREAETSNGTNWSLGGSDVTMDLSRQFWNGTNAALADEIVDAKTVAASSVWDLLLSFLYSVLHESDPIAYSIAHPSSRLSILFPFSVAHSPEGRDGAFTISRNASSESRQHPSIAMARKSRDVLQGEDCPSPPFDPPFTRRPTLNVPSPARL